MLPAGLKAGPDFGAGVPVELMLGVFAALFVLGLFLLRRI